MFWLKTRNIYKVLYLTFLIKMQNIITNPKRKKQIKEFFDKNHKVMSKYYDLSEKELTYKQMKKLIKQDPDFYDSYLIASDILKHEGKSKQAKELLYTGYTRALKRIVDNKGNFPKIIEWGWLENRHVVRIIERWGFEVWESGEEKQALEIFRKLLKTNLNDNIGARYNILAIRLGLGSDYEEKFACKDDPDYIDANKIWNWFEKHRKRFPDEFDWWFKAVKGSK